MIRAAQARAIRKRYKEVAPVLDEQGRRRFAAAEALALGRGGVSLMARITGLARPTIYRGIFDIRNKSSAGPGRTRKVGGGRKAKEVQNPTLLTDLKRLVQPVTRGDPMRVILWTARSLRNLEKELKKLGHKVSPMTVGKLLRSMDYSLQANSKTKEGRQHVDRDAQFQYIDEQSRAFLKARQPVISCDTNYARNRIMHGLESSGSQSRAKSMIFGHENGC